MENVERDPILKIVSHHAPNRIDPITGARYKPNQDIPVSVAVIAPYDDSGWHSATVTLFGDAVISITSLNGYYPSLEACKYATNALSRGDTWEGLQAVTKGLTCPLSGLGLPMVERIAKASFTPDWLKEEALRELKANAYVYLISDSQGNYKIGRSGDVTARLSSLQTGSPNPLTLIASFRCRHTERCEVLLHERFQSKRKTGEWFCLDEEDREWFADLLWSCEWNNQDLYVYLEDKTDSWRVMF